MLKQMTRAVFAVAAAGGFVACDDNGPQGGSVSVSFAVPARTSAQLLSAVNAADTISDGVHTLDVQAIDVNFDEIVFERLESETPGDSDGESDADSDSDGIDNEKVRTNATITLPLQGGVITPITAGVAAGRYEKVEMDVASIRVRGTFDGQAFDTTIPVNDELELEFNPPLEIGGTATTNVTVRIDPANWFRTSGGQVIDPRALATDASLRSEIRNRIRSSFKAFEDSDKDADDADSDSDRS